MSKRPVPNESRGRRAGFCLLVWLVVILCATASAMAQSVYRVPQVIDGENAPDFDHYFHTEFTLVNLSSTTSVDVVLSLTSDDGTPFDRLHQPGSPPVSSNGSTISFSIPGGGSRTIGTENGPFRIVGWAAIEATGDLGVVVTLQYLVSGTSEVVTSTSLIPEDLTDFFSTAAFVGVRATGLALLNPSETDSAEVRIDLYRQGGTFEESRTITLQPLEKIAQFLNEGELFTDLQEFSGTAEVSSTQPLAVTVIRVDGTYWTTFRVFPGRVRE